MHDVYFAFYFNKLVFESRDKINSADVYNTSRPFIITNVSFYRTNSSSKIKTALNMTEINETSSG